MIRTGKFDKSGQEICVGDTVHFRTDGLCGKGIVYLADDPDELGMDLFRIIDTREGKNFGRIYPYYSRATYRIDRKAEENADKTELILKVIEDSSVRLYGSNNSGNYLIPVSRVVEIIQEA